MGYQKHVTNLPASPEPSEGLQFDIRGLGEKLTIYHGIQEPLPVFLCHIRDKPRITFSVEADLSGQPALEQEIRC
jgi:hypothetical protein